MNSAEKFLAEQREALKAAQFHFALVKSNTACIGASLCHVDGNCVRCLAATSELRIRAALAELDRIAAGGEVGT